MIVLDSHCDAPSQMVRLRDFSRDNAFAQVDFPKMVRGGVDASFFAAYVPASKEGQAATDWARKLLDETDRQVAACAGRVAYARCAGGVRYVTLTHSADNQVGDSCTGVGTWGGLSPFGKRLVPEMNRRRMLNHVANPEDSSFLDVLESSERPIAYTHGACRALASHRRNLPDELIRGIAERGGVVSISIYPPFLDDGFVRTLAESGLEKKLSVEDAFIQDPADAAKRAAWEAVQRELQALPRPGIGRVVDHIEHAVSVAGIDHVGIGTDYDGIEVTVAGLEDISCFSRLWDEMRRRGFSQRDIDRIAGKNFLRVLTAVRK